MKQRTTVIIGAGAVLDFNFDNITYPSTANITDIISRIKVEGLYNKESNIISTIYSEINQIIEKSSNITINFEELYSLLEHLWTINTISNKNTDYGSRIYSPRAIPLYGHFVDLQKHIDFPNIEYERALINIISTITNIINQYNQKFNENILYESWYRQFWKNREKQWDIFTLNYDTTIENSLTEYEDGFESVHNTNYEHFNPTKLYQNNKQLSTIHHLHGCINYAELNPKEFQSTHSNRDMYKLTNWNLEIMNEYLEFQCPPITQTHSQYINSPIIIGQRKLDKQTFLPYSIYHANLANKIIQNKNLLIIGYSFGDLYINQLIERHKLIHGKNQKIIIIDKFPEYINSNIDLYQFITNKINGNMREFFLRQFNFGITPDLKIRGLNIKSHYSPIYSEDQCTMLLINGFKSAATENKEDLYNFLDRISE